MHDLSPSCPPSHVVICNRADGGIVYWTLKLYLILAIFVTAIGIGFVPLAYRWASGDVPKTPDLSRYFDRAVVGSVIVSHTNYPLAELSRQYRRLTPFSRMPRKLVEAFLAAEDAEFFRHGGIDLRGVLRAMWANLRAGIVRQGGSTITQQVAKAYLSPERSVSRKLKELLMARRIEAKFSKEQILNFYLNHIYMGSNSYGVTAASRTFFSKELSDLTIAEMALLAGLARAPSRYAPHIYPERARQRRNQVLALMKQNGYISDRVFDDSVNQKIALKKRSSHNPITWVAPHFAEHIRRLLVTRYGEARVYGSAWTISTTLDLSSQDFAIEASHDAVHALDKRQGYRGPEMHATTDQLRHQILARLDRLYPEKQLHLDRSYLALVEKVGTRSVVARIGSNRSIEISFSRMQWAAPYSKTNPENNRTIGSPASVVAKGDLIWVAAPPRWQRGAKWGQQSERPIPMVLDQMPRVEAAMFAYDHQTGYIKVMVGGNDFDQTSFNRTVQACRQPGSAYKPIFFSLALDGTKYSMGSILQDKPYVPDPGEEWNPQNVHGTLDGKVTMHYALVRSLNLPSIQLLKSVGADRTAKWARRLGFTTPIHADKALALGASCVRMDELTRAFATFVRGGTQRDSFAIRQIRDRWGHLLEDHTVVEDPLLSEDERLERLWATSREKHRQVIDERTAFLMTKLLRDSVTYGIAARCRIVPVPTGGKGGTSSDTMDVWFAGFTSQWAITSWIGDDSYQRPLGAKEASYTSAIPMWANFMKRAVGTRPHRELPLERPPGLKTANIDFLSGGPAQAGSRAVTIYFKPGTYDGPRVVD